MTPDDLAPYDDGKTWRTEGLDTTRTAGTVVLAVIAGYTGLAFAAAWWIVK